MVAVNPQLLCHRVEQVIWLMSGKQLPSLSGAHLLPQLSPSTVVSEHLHQVTEEMGIPPFSVEPSAWLTLKEFCNHTRHDTYLFLYLHT